MPWSTEFENRGTNGTEPGHRATTRLGKNPVEVLGQENGVCQIRFPRCDRVREVKRQDIEPYVREESSDHPSYQENSRIINELRDNSVM